MSIRVIHPFKIFCFGKLIGAIFRKPKSKRCYCLRGLKTKLAQGLNSSKSAPEEQEEEEEEEEDVGVLTLAYGWHSVPLSLVRVTRQVVLADELMICLTAVSDRHLVFTVVDVR